jgi:hypothetical protein
MASPTESLFDFEFTAESGPTGSIQPSTALVADYATVFSFIIWDHDLGQTTTYPRMAIRETIARMRGKVNEKSALLIEPGALDRDGFYQPNADGGGEGATSGKVSE